MKDTVIDTIKNREIKMHTRGYFVARAIFLIFIAVLLFLFIFMLTTFMIFALRLNGGFYAVGLGPSEWLVFLNALPWSLMLLSIALILILWLLLRRYAVVYHQPFLYILLFLIVVISLAYFSFSVNGINDQIFHYVSHGQIPVITSVYEFETAPASGVYRGQIVLIATSSFILANELGQTSTVLMLPRAIWELGGLRSGDYVLIFGRVAATDTIQGSDLEKIQYYK